MNRKLAILFGVGLIGLGCLSADLRAAETANPKVRQLSQIFGDQSASKKALALVRDKRANVDDRRNALRALVNQRNVGLTETLNFLLDDDALRVDAIRAYGAIEDKQAPRLILARYSKLDFQGKRAVVETLSSRKNYATALLVALKENTVPRKDLPVYLARSLSTLLGESFTSWYGDVRELSKDRAASIRRLKALLTPERLAKADARNGRDMFRSICAGCHSLYGGGGRIGPDLTGFNRANTDYLLLNMIDPSADIQDAYKLVIIDTKDGQFLAGTIAQEDGQRVVMNLARQRQAVLKSNIVSRKVSDLSMMPEGTLTGLPDNLALDLVKYLQTTKQVPLP
jgi:putative heme-binding domain-containing protein